MKNTPRPTKDKKAFLTSVKKNGEASKKKKGPPSAPTSFRSLADKQLTVSKSETVENVLQEGIVKLLNKSESESKIIYESNTVQQLKSFWNERVKKYEQINLANSKTTKNNNGFTDGFEYLFQLRRKLHEELITKTSQYALELDQNISSYNFQGKFHRLLTLNNDYVYDPITCAVQAKNCRKNISKSEAFTQTFNFCCSSSTRSNEAVRNTTANLCETVVFDSKKRNHCRKNLNSMFSLHFVVKTLDKISSVLKFMSVEYKDIPIYSEHIHLTPEIKCKLIDLVNIVQTEYPLIDTHALKMNEHLTEIDSSIMNHSITNTLEDKVSTPLKREKSTPVLVLKNNERDLKLDLKNLKKRTESHNKEHITKSDNHIKSAINIDGKKNSVSNFIHGNEDILKKNIEGKENKTDITAKVNSSSSYKFQNIKKIPVDNKKPLLVDCNVGSIKEDKWFSNCSLSSVNIQEKQIVEINDRFNEKFPSNRSKTTFELDETEVESNVRGLHSESMVEVKPSSQLYDVFNIVLVESEEYIYDPDTTAFSGGGDSIFDCENGQLSSLRGNLSQTAVDNSQQSDCYSSFDVEYFNGNVSMVAPYDSKISERSISVEHIVPETTLHGELRPLNKEIIIIDYEKAFTYGELEFPDDCSDDSMDIGKYNSDSYQDCLDETPEATEESLLCNIKARPITKSASKLWLRKTPNGITKFSKIHQDENNDKTDSSLTCVVQRGVSELKGNEICHRAYQEVLNNITSSDIDKTFIKNHFMKSLQENNFRNPGVYLLFLAECYPDIRKFEMIFLMEEYRRLTEINKKSFCWKETFLNFIFSYTEKCKIVFRMNALRKFVQKKWSEIVLPNYSYCVENMLTKEGILFIYGCALAVSLIIKILEERFGWLSS